MIVTRSRTEQGTRGCRELALSSEVDRRTGYRARMEAKSYAGVMPP